jgi:4-hydroxybenzoate polyprenyltransferase
VEAIGVWVGLSLTAFALVLTLDRLTILYAVCGAALTAIYPFLKRFFPVPQLWLGAAFTWSVPMAFAAELHAVPRLAWLLFVAGVLWSVVYDTMYAMVDRDDDLKLGIKSAAITFGEADRWVLGTLQVIVLTALWLAGEEAVLGRWYRLGLAAGAVFFVYQQWLIRRRDRAECFRAFINNQWFGLVVFFGIALDYLFEHVR